MRNKWFFDKRINLSFFLAGFMLFVTAIGWAAQIQKRIALLEMKLEAFDSALMAIDEQQSNQGSQQNIDLEQLYSQLNHFESDQ